MYTTPGTVTQEGETVPVRPSRSCYGNLDVVIPCVMYVSLLLPSNYAPSMYTGSHIIHFSSAFRCSLHEVQGPPRNCKFFETHQMVTSSCWQHASRSQFFHTDWAHFNYHQSLFTDVCVCGLNFQLLGKRMENVGIRLYNKLPDHTEKLDNFKSLKRELETFLLHRAVYSVDEFMSFCSYVGCESVRALSLVILTRFHLCW